MIEKTKALPAISEVLLCKRTVVKGVIKKLSYN